jgi:hypothetical protein
MLDGCTGVEKNHVSRRDEVFLKSKSSRLKLSSPKGIPEPKGSEYFRISMVSKCHRCRTPVR